LRKLSSILVTMGREKTCPVTPKTPEGHFQFQMEKESARQKKRDSGRKASEYTVYTKKAVRIKEALLEKQKVATLFKK